ncbi:MAG: YraN family protein [Bacteroidales bacterium]|nr:YraN family protein [Bacteroidales bacterium]
MAEHNELGEKGENAAIEFLLQNGYKILETNWTYGRKEIDIIAQDRDILVIIEVKTRQTDFFGEPEEFVSNQKQILLIKAANAYILLKKLNLEVRFDIISIVKNPDKTKINHIKDAFYPKVRRWN